MPATVPGEVAGRLAVMVVMTVPLDVVDQVPPSLGPGGVLRRHVRSVLGTTAGVTRAVIPKSDYADRPADLPSSHAPARDPHEVRRPRARRAPRPVDDARVLAWAEDDLPPAIGAGLLATLPLALRRKAPLVSFLLVMIGIEVLT